MKRTLNIKDIPIKDIYYFLSENGISLLDIKNEENAYQLAEELIMSGVVENAPSSIVNWILAYNSSKLYNLEKYNLSEIIEAPNDDLLKLSDKLGLEDTDKFNIIEILSYMDKLNNDSEIFELLPHDTLIDIMSHLDFKSIKLMSEISINTRKVYESKQFKPILKEIIEKQKIDYANNLYGRVTNDGNFRNFRIIDKNSDKIEEDNRLNNMGRLCNSYKRNYLIDIMWEFGVPLSNKNFIDDKDKLIDGLLNTSMNKRIKDHTYDEIIEWNLYKLNYYFKLYNNLKEYNTKKICNLIEERMKELDKIEYLYINLYINLYMNELSSIYFL